MNVNHTGHWGRGCDIHTIFICANENGQRGRPIPYLSSSNHPDSIFSPLFHPSNYIRLLISLHTDFLGFSQVITAVNLQILQLIVRDGTILLFSGRGIPGDAKGTGVNGRAAYVLGRGARHCREGREGGKSATCAVVGYILFVAGYILQWEHPVLDICSNIFTLEREQEVDCFHAFPRKNWYCKWMYCIPRIQRKWKRCFNFPSSLRLNFVQLTYFSELLWKDFPFCGCGELLQ